MTVNRIGFGLLALPLLGGMVMGAATGLEPVRITSAVQLFIDDHLIETTKGMRRTVHQWEKYPGNPVLRADKPWEFGGRYITYASVIYDRQEHVFKAWYWTLNDEDSEIPTTKIKSMCYATSPDGINWQKPNLGLFEFQGSKDNNIVMASRWENLKSVPTLFTFGAIKTPWDPDPRRLYKACFYERPTGVEYMSSSDGVWGAISRDGIHWIKSKAPIMNSVGDTVGFFYDSIHGKYVCFGKRYTDRGRSRFQCQSKDFVNWTQPHLIMKTDDQDDQPCDLYNNTGFVWGDMLLSWLQVFYHDKDPYRHRLVVELMYSRDGLNWCRMPNRQTVLDVGPDGSYERTNQSPAGGEPIVVGNRMYMYYGADTKYHDGGGEHHGNICLGTLRRDGFVSMDANPHGGVLTTKPLLLAPQQSDGLPIQVHVNVKSDWGHCLVELLDEAGRAIPGYSKDQADDIVTDTVDTIVTWGGKGDIGNLMRQPIRLRFHLQNARLYSFRISTTSDLKDDL